MNFIVNVPVIVGIILLFVGVVTRRYPPRKINMNYGYRTKRSMKNQEVWNYAQSIYPVLLMKGGMSLVFLGIVMWLLDSSQPAVAIVGTAGMFIVIIVLFVNVEKKLKQFERSQESNSNS